VTRLTLPDGTAGFAWSPLEEARRLGDAGGPPSEVTVTGEPGILRRTTRYRLVDDGETLVAETVLELAPAPVLDVAVSIALAGEGVA